jgi:cell division septal protein FtsQ
MANDKASKQPKTNRWLPTQRRQAILRVAVLVLGVAAVVSGFVLWLTPALHTKTTADENTTTTVIDSAGHTKTNTRL